MYKIYKKTKENDEKRALEKSKKKKKKGKGKGKKNKDKDKETAKPGKPGDMTKAKTQGLPQINTKDIEDENEDSEC